MYISYVLLALGLLWCVLCAIYEYKYNDDFKDIIKLRLFNIKMWYRLKFIKINLIKRLEFYKVE
jgi:hypothetical protein